MLNKVLELYYKALNIYKAVHKKWIGAHNMTENVSIDLYLDKDHLPPMLGLEGDEQEKLEPEEFIAKRLKLKHRTKKTQKTETRLKILTSDNLLTARPILLV